MTLPTTMRAVQYTEYGASNVLTINQVHSRRSPDRVPELLVALADVGVLAPFERTVGDKVQGVPADAAAALAASCSHRGPESWAGRSPVVPS